MKDLNNKNSNVNDMGLVGMGRGYLGLHKNKNKWIRLFFIWVAFGLMGIYLLKINQFWAGIISFACGLMFTAFNNFLRD